MEFLYVQFDENREVRVDDARRGKTNIVIELEAGEYDVTLGPPFDFSPAMQTVILTNTAALAPYRIVFQRLPPSAIPLSPGSQPV